MPALTLAQALDPGLIGKTGLDEAVGDAELQRWFGSDVVHTKHESAVLAFGAAVGVDPGWAADDLHRRFSDPHRYHLGVGRERLDRRLKLQSGGEMQLTGRDVLRMAIELNAFRGPDLQLMSWGKDSGVQTIEVTTS